MALNLAVMHRFIAKEVVSKRSLRDSMDRIISKGAKENHHKDWDKLQRLAYEDLDDLRDWIEKPFRLDSSSVKLAGLWFGLFNPIYKRNPVADIYVCGSTQFDSTPDDNSWAVDPDWCPEHRYAKSAILAKIYKIAYGKGGLGNDAEYPLCLAYGCLAVRDLIQIMDPKLFLGLSSTLGIAVGFDSGDFIPIGTLTKRGLTLFPREKNNDPCLDTMKK
jgi:hypothetical protein